MDEVVFCYECGKNKECRHQYVCGVNTCNEAERIVTPVTSKCDDGAIHIDKIDLCLIKDYAENRYSHPCNSCYICQPSGFLNDNAKKKCNERLALFGMVEQKVIAYLTIKKYIEKFNYTWSVEELLKEYTKKIAGMYVSYTADDCFKNNKKEFQILNTLN